MNTKVCTGCKRELPLVSFHKEARSQYGVQSRCKECRKKSWNSYYQNNKDKVHAINRGTRERARIAALRHYSGGDPLCACCGETELVFLTIDHINNDGHEHRKSRGSWASYAYKGMGYPEGLQVLCMNCNWARRYGDCPHKVRV